jgi:glycerol-3-phosphate dehydrogenase
MGGGLGRYLPGVKLPENIYAEPDLRKAIKGAHILVFVVPHQVLPYRTITKITSIHNAMICCGML